VYISVSYVSDFVCVTEKKRREREREREEVLPYALFTSLSLFLLFSSLHDCHVPCATWGVRRMPVGVVRLWHKRWAFEPSENRLLHRKRIDCGSQAHFERGGREGEAAKKRVRQTQREGKQTDVSKELTKK
jgi:hypothetical protein